MTVFLLFLGSGLYVLHICSIEKILALPEISLKKVSTHISIKYPSSACICPSLTEFTSNPIFRQVDLLPLILLQSQCGTSFSQRRCKLPPNIQIGVNILGWRVAQVALQSLRSSVHFGLQNSFCRLDLYVTISFPSHCTTALKSRLTVKDVFCWKRRWTSKLPCLRTSKICRAVKKRCS